MKITLEFRQNDLPISESSVDGLVREVLAFLEVSTDEIILHFIEMPEMQKLHEEFFSDPSPTDCITFPIDPPNSKDPISGSTVLGEIFIAPRAALDYAPDQAYLETSLYIVHGILHLLGYDDILPEDQKAMRLAEKRVIDHLKEKKCILSNPFPQYT